MVGREREAQLSAESRAPWLGRLLASLRALSSPPGRLTAEWGRGRRVCYIAPLPLFLWTNVAFFIAQSASHLGVLSWPMRVHLAQDGFGPLSSRLLASYGPGTSGPGSAYEPVFDALESVHAKSLVILMVPGAARRPQGQVFGVYDLCTARGTSRLRWRRSGACLDGAALDRHCCWSS